jgi:amidase
MPYFKQETLISSNKKGDLLDSKYKEALNNSHFKAIQILDKVIGDNKLDAICGITSLHVVLVYMVIDGEMFFNSSCYSGFPHNCSLRKGI